AGVGGLEDLHAVADAIEEIVDVACTRIERGSGEEVGRVVEGSVDLLARRETALGRREQLCGRLQRQQVLANRRRENDIRHNPYLPGVGRTRSSKSGPPASCSRKNKKM